MPAVFSSLNNFSVVAFFIAVIVAAIMTVSGASAAYHKFSDLPKFIDWRNKGVVGNAPSQGQCGNSALFVAVSQIQSVSAIANGDKLVDLSYNELETCMSNGCNGGLMQDAYKWVLEHGGRVAPASANITKDSCSNVDKLPVGARVESIRTLAHSEYEIHRALVSGPVFVSVDATSWQVYSGGILNSCSFDQLNHAALVVGVNLEYSTPYWILQNSWSTSWGENGYIRISFGTNQCGINSYPIAVNCGKL